jgi:hypothetical protein
MNDNTYPLISDPEKRLTVQQRNLDILNTRIEERERHINKLKDLIAGEEVLITQLLVQKKQASLAVTRAKVEIGAQLEAA